MTSKLGKFAWIELDVSASRWQQRLTWFHVSKLTLPVTLFNCAWTTANKKEPDCFSFADSPDTNSPTHFQLSPLK